jgi:uncharacterized DUF497 family protein
MQYEWDEEKRQKTLSERGIDFLDAMKVWLDPQRQERVDLRQNYGEVRIQTVGQVTQDILFVVYTERIYTNGVQIVRIISARMAKEKEREAYLNRTFHLGVTL